MPSLRLWRATAWLGATLCVFPAVSAKAQPVWPVGENIQISTATATLHFEPEAVALSNRRFVVVWQDSANDIKGRLLDVSGHPSGPETTLNSWTLDSQEHPSITALPDGGFVVAWQSLSSAGTDTSGLSIQARRFDPEGMPLGPDFQVNTHTADQQIFPQVAAGGDGTFVVVWNSYLPSPSLDIDVVAQRYTVEGQPLWGELRINSTEGRMRESSVAVAPSGDWVVVWQAYEAGHDASCYGILAQRLGRSGAFLGEEIQVNTQTSGCQRRPSVAALPDNSFYVVWEHEGTLVEPPSIRGQRIAADGLLLGGEVEVNGTSPIPFAITLPRITADSLGHVAAVWQHPLSREPYELDVLLRSSALDGLPPSPEVRLNEGEIAESPSIAASEAGDFLVVWSDGEGIRARRLTSLFADGFEAGSTSAWSTTVGTR